MNLLKKLFLSVGFVLPLGNYCMAQYITLHGKQFYNQQGNPFFPMVMNYTGNIFHDQLPPTQFKVTRGLAYGTQGCPYFEGGYTWTNCENSLADDFIKIKSMGFNTVRFNMPVKHNDGNAGFSIQSSIFSNSTAVDFCTAPKYTFQLDPATTYTNTDAQEYFSLIAHILDIADANDMKVIFLCADHSNNGFPEMGTNATTASDYAVYLGALANYLKDKPALLSYELYPEPHWSVANHGLSEVKEDICSYVGWWYDAIKAVDHHHLVNMEGTDIGDVMDWDGSVMKIDFIAMHLYPVFRDFESYDNAKAIDRLLNMISWCSSTLQRPWIVGETGYSTAPDACINSFPGAADGSYTDEYNFISTILPAVRDCGASGFSWWEFQDTHWYCVPANMCTTCTYCNICSGSQSLPSELHGNYWGLLEYADPVSGVYPSGADKDAVAFTIAFDEGNGTPAPATCVAPTANYYNPHQYPASSGTVSGTVLDINGDPIENAVIFASDLIHDVLGDPFQGHSRGNYSYSQNAGIFNVIPAPDVYYPTVVENIIIASCSSERVSRGWNNISIDTSPTGETFNLNSALINYNISIDNRTVYSNTTENFKAWSNLTTSNLIIENNATSDITAREEIHVTPGFDANTGSEVHIFTSIPIVCSEYNGYLEQRHNYFTEETGTDNQETNGIEINFTENQRNSVSVFPNPSTGIFKVELNSSNKNSIIQSIIIYDIMNRKVNIKYTNTKTVFLDLSNLPKGIYFLRINDKINLLNQKIVIN